MIKILKCLFDIAMVVSNDVFQTVKQWRINFHCNIADTLYQL